MLPSSSIYQCLILQTPAVPLKLNASTLKTRTVLRNKVSSWNRLHLVNQSHHVYVIPTTLNHPDVSILKMGQGSYGKITMWHKIIKDLPAYSTSILFCMLSPSSKLAFIASLFNDVEFDVVAYFSKKTMLKLCLWYHPSVIQYLNPKMFLNPIFLGLYNPSSNKSLIENGNLNDNIWSFVRLFFIYRLCRCNQI